MAKVLIVMATKNRDYCLERALDSIERQTEGDWNLVVIDDNSSDNTQDILSRYVEEDDRISYINNRDGKHFGVVKQEIMLDSKEEFLAQLDDDDVWNMHYLERMIAELEKNPKASEAYCNYWLENEEGKKRYYNSSKNIPFPDTLPSLSLFRGDLFRQMGGWDMETFHIEGSYIHCEADFYIRAKEDNDVIHVDEALVTIHKAKKSMSTSRVLNVKGMEALMYKWRHELVKNPKVWAQYCCRLGLHEIEGDVRTWKIPLREAIRADAFIWQGWGALILASISRQLFLRCYEIYRKISNR